MGADEALSDLLDGLLPAAEPAPPPPLLPYLPLHLLQLEDA